MTKPTKWHVRLAKTQISLGIRPVWSESSLSAWRKLGSWATHWAHSEDSDQTGRMPRLIWVFAGRTYHLVGFVMRRLIGCCYWSRICGQANIDQTGRMPRIIWVFAGRTLILLVLSRGGSNVLALMVVNLHTFPNIRTLTGSLADILPKEAWHFYQVFFTISSLFWSFCWSIYNFASLRWPLFFFRPFFWSQTQGFLLRVSSCDLFAK